MSNAPKRSVRGHVPGLRRARGESTATTNLADWLEPFRTRAASRRSREGNDGRAGIRRQDGLDVIKEGVTQDRVSRRIGALQYAGAGLVDGVRHHVVVITGFKGEAAGLL